MQPRIGVGVVRPDHADHLAGAERHADHVAGLQIELGRHPIGIGLVKRHRHQHVDDAGRGNRAARGLCIDDSKQTETAGQLYRRRLDPTSGAGFSLHDQVTQPV